MNTTVKTVVALIGWYDEFGCEVSWLRYREEIIFWIDEKVDMDARSQVSGLLRIVKPRGISRATTSPPVGSFSISNRAAVAVQSRQVSPVCLPNPILCRDAIRAFCSASMPGPLSFTSIRTTPFRGAAVTSTRPEVEFPIAWRIAFSTIGWSIRFGTRTSSTSGSTRMSVVSRS